MFNDDLDFDNKEHEREQEKIHLRLQQRNRHKCVMSITGLSHVYDLKRICKYLKREFKCNGAVIHDDTYGDVIQLQGNHQEGVIKFLIKEDIATKNMIVTHIY